MARAAFLDRRPSRRPAIGGRRGIGSAQAGPSATLMLTAAVRSSTTSRSSPSSRWVSRCTRIRSASRILRADSLRLVRADRRRVRKGQAAAASVSDLRANSVRRAASRYPPSGCPRNADGGRQLPDHTMRDSASRGSQAPAAISVSHGTPGLAQAVVGAVAGQCCAGTI